MSLWEDLSAVLVTHVQACTRGPVLHWSKVITGGRPPGQTEPTVTHTVRTRVTTDESEWPVTTAGGVLSKVQLLLQATGLSFRRRSWVELALPDWVCSGCVCVSCMRKKVGLRMVIDLLIFLYNQNSRNVNLNKIKTKKIQITWGNILFTVEHR